MSDEDRSKTKMSVGQATLSRREMLVAAAMSVGSVSALSLPTIARAATPIADKRQSAAVEEIAREETLTFGANPYMHLSLVARCGVAA